MGATLLALLRVRVELVGVELKEEAERRKHMLVLALVAAFFLASGLLLAAFLVVVLFWDSYRLPAIAGVTLVYSGIGAWAFLRFRNILANSPPAFSATLKEFRKDLDFLQGHDE
jgi:uncharacterized membrane protein YqjE